MDDFKVTVGDGVCKMISLTDSQFVCQPPYVRPNMGNSSLCSGGRLPVDVRNVIVTTVIVSLYIVRQSRLVTIAC